MIDRGDAEKIFGRFATHSSLVTRLEQICVSERASMKCILKLKLMDAIKKLKASNTKHIKLLSTFTKQTTYLLASS